MTTMKSVDTALFNISLTWLVDVLAGVTLKPSLSPSPYTDVRINRSRRMNKECVAWRVLNQLFGNSHL